MSSQWTAVTEVFQNVCVCVSPPKHSARTPILFARVASLMKTFQRLDFKHNFKKLWTANQQQSQDRAVR